jgi:hypothetical protein
MKLNQTKKQWLVVVASGLLCATSVFAQHQGGTNGPANSTYPDTNPLATVDSVLTHDQIQQIVSNCASAEILKVARVLTKTNTLQFEPALSFQFFDGPMKEFQMTENTFDSAGSINAPNTNIAVGQTMAEFQNRITLFFTINSANYQDYKQHFPFDSLQIQTADSLPVLVWDETLLPTAIDEYGRVDETQAVVSNLRWTNTVNQLNPGDLTAQYQFYNSDAIDPATGKNTIVSGVFFDMASYSSCINSQTGLK